MIRFGTNSGILALATLLVACAGPQTPTPVQTVPAAPEKVPYKKPVRMHGRGKLSSISLEDFFLLHQSGKALVFDARLGFFYNLGHIPGAIHLPKADCDEQIHAREAEIQSALAAGRSIVVYCSGPGCPDARAVAMHLNGFGHPAAVFSGGWDAWKDAGMPTE